MKNKFIFLLCTLIPLVNIAQGIINNVYLEEKFIGVVYIDTLRQKVYESRYKIHKENSVVYFNIDRQKVYVRSHITILDSVIRSYIDKKFTPDTISYSTYAIISVCFIIDKNGDIICRGLVRGSTEESFEKKIRDIIHKCDLKFPVFYDNKGRPSAYYYYYSFGIP